MKKATVKIALNPNSFPGGGFAETPGYAAEIDGQPVVIHRPLVNRNGKPSFSSGGWTVTEPTTGLMIRPARGSETRDHALEAATALVEREGGATAIRAAMEKAPRFAA